MPIQKTGSGGLTRLRAGGLTRLRVGGLTTRLRLTTRLLSKQKRSLERAVQRQKKNDRLAVQRVRLLVRHPYTWTPQCVAAASAAELFAPYVCLSTHAIDARIFTLSDVQDVSPETPKSEIKNSEIENAKEHGENIQFMSASATRNDGGQLVMRWQPSIVDRSDCRHRFQAFKIAETGHITIWLFDRKRFTMEIFDSAGSPMRRRFIRKIMDLLFGKEARHPKAQQPKVRHPTWRYVNQQQLQIDSADNYCQTYIYYYLYQRLLVGEPAYRIVTQLQKMSQKERIIRMQQFWTYLTQS
jgi:hypothetical protein